MNFVQGSLTVKLTVALEGQNIGTIRPHLKRGCWRRSKQDCAFWESQHLQPQLWVTASKASKHTHTMFVHEIFNQNLERELFTGWTKPNSPFGGHRVYAC